MVNQSDASVSTIKRIDQSMVFAIKKTNSPNPTDRKKESPTSKRTILAKPTTVDAHTHTKEVKKTWNAIQPDKVL